MNADRRATRRATVILVWSLCFVGGCAAAAAVRGFQRRAGGREPAASRASQSAGDRARPRDPAAAEREFQAGFRQLQAGRFSEALEAFHRAASLDGTDPRPHYGMGEVYKKLVLKDKAEAAFRKAVEIRSDYLPARKNLAKVLHDVGKYGEAVRVLEEIETTRPEDAEVWAELAINALALGDAAKAILLLERYNAAVGRQAWGCAHLGRAYAEAGETAKAEASLREALSIDRRFTMAHYWLGQLLATTGREDESVAVLGRYRRLRDLETRSHQLRMALLENPDDVLTLVRLAEARFRLGHREEALSLLERARALAPDDARLGKLYRNIRQSRE